jgi:hypothetical protein
LSPQQNNAPADEIAQEWSEATDTEVVDVRSAASLLALNPNAEATMPRKSATTAKAMNRLLRLIKIPRASPLLCGASDAKGVNFPDVGKGIIGFW